MDTDTIEERLSELEKRVKRIEFATTTSSADDPPWWHRIAGRFADNTEFDEAMRLGREHRESLGPTDSEDA